MSRSAAQAAAHAAGAAHAIASTAAARDAADPGPKTTTTTRPLTARLRRQSRRETAPGAVGARRRHAAKVALAATAIAALGALGTGFALDMLVVHRLQAEGDARLATRLHDMVAIRHLDPAQPPPPGHSTDGDGDYDDAPALVWLVRADGTSTALSSGAPLLPVRQWSSGRVVSVPVAERPFRFEAAAVGTGWVVVGASAGQVDRVRTDLVVVELLVGAVLLGVVYLGALAVGLRASAPVEEFRRRQADFTADASHELRTPLSVIQAEVGLALGRDRSDAYYRDTLRRVADESGRLRSIVDDLLWLARTDAHSDRPPDRLIDVGGVAEETVGRFAAVAAERDVRLAWVGDHTGAAIRAPAGWIDRLAAVLVDNACRYVQPGGQIYVTVTGRGHHVTLTVDDDGPGVPPEQRPLLLDRFHRVAETADTAGGTGLGLAIADSVVRMTGGQWSIGDAPLGGARFAVTWRSVALPTAPAPTLVPQ